MIEDWKIYRIKDIAESMSDAPFGSMLKNQDYTDMGALVVQGKNIQGRRFDWSDRRFVSLEKYQSLPRSHCFPGDLIFPKVGTIGKVGIMTPFGNQKEYILSTNTMRLRPDKNIACPDYVYYFFTSPQIVNLIQALNSKSVQPVFNFTTLKNFEILLPRLSVQNAIAHILRTLDEKIELNHQMNETLETISRAVFKSWFVDLDPVRANLEGREPFGMDAETIALFPNSFISSVLGEVPIGWRVGKVSDICTSQYGYTASASKKAIGPHLLRITDMNKEPWIDWQTVPYCEISDEHFPRYKVQLGDILVSRMADPGKAAIIEEEVLAVFASYLVRLKTQDIPTSYFLFYFLRSDQYVEYAQASMSGTVQMGMNAKVIISADMLIPSRKIIEVFYHTVLPLRQKIILNLQENQNLTSIRDALLPKLLSGEIRVKDAEKLVEAHI